MVCLLSTFNAFLYSSIPFNVASRRSIINHASGDIDVTLPRRADCLQTRFRQSQIADLTRHITSPLQLQVLSHSGLELIAIDFAAFHWNIISGRIPSWILPTSMPRTEHKDTGIREAELNEVCLDELVFVLCTMYCFFVAQNRNLIENLGRDYWVRGVDVSRVPTF